MSELPSWPILMPPGWVVSVIPLHAANLWLHPNEPGQRDRFANASPFLMELHRGIAITTDADLYPRLAPTFEWDVAAGNAVLAGAGGLVTRPDGTPLVYGQVADEFRVPAFLAFGDPAAVPRIIPPARC